VGEREEAGTLSTTHNDGEDIVHGFKGESFGHG
jgi:hypothetical protein